MRSKALRLALLFGVAVIALVAVVAYTTSTASADTYQLGCLCPAGTLGVSGTLSEGVDPTYAHTPCCSLLLFPPFGTSSCSSSTVSEYDLVQLEICDPNKMHALTVTQTVGGDGHMDVYWNNGNPNPFTGATCTNNVCGDDDSGGSLRARCTIPAVAGVGLKGFVDIAMSSYSSSAMGAWTLSITSPTPCPKPMVDGVDIATANLDDACFGAPVAVTFTVANTGDLDQPDNAAGNVLAGHEFRATITGNWTILSAAPDAGTCSFAGNIVNCDFEIPAGAARVVSVLMDPYGGLGTTESFGALMQVELDQDLNGYNEALFEYETEDPFVIECPYIIDPNAQLGMQVHLPILSFKGMDTCEVWIEVQNVGCLPVKAVLVTWGEAGFCPPQAAGPLKVECTGLLSPGTTWNLLGDQIPDGSKSGMLFRFSTKQLSDVGLDTTFGFDDILADLMCETLFFGVVGDADDFRRFKKAYNEGGDFGGIPQDVAAGWDDPGILAVDVLRTCDADQTAGAKVTSKYNGIAGSHLGQYDPVYGGYTYYVPLIFAARSDFNTWVYIQNGGLECSSVEIWMKAQDDCLRARICEVSTLAPGETLQFDPAQCVNVTPGQPGQAGGWLGSAWIRTSQPMGIAVDIWGRDVLMTYVGEPGELNYTFDPSQASATPGNQVAFGPLVYSEYQGWETGIQVQNLSPVVNAKVKVYFLDRSGDVITTLIDWICPRGSQSFFLPVVHNLPGNWVGSVRVESQEWLTPGGPRVLPPNIVAVATLMKYSDVQKAETQEAIAYNLLPEHKIFDWQIGLGGGGLNSGVGLIAIPSLLADLDGTGVTSELAIANVVPKPGFTDFAIFIYDQNGLLDYVCQKLNEKQVEYIDFNSWGYINNGFKGSAIISAYFWEHDVFSGDGRFLRNLVGLGAVVIERSRATLGTQAPGDEAAGARGIPFKQSDVDDEEFEFCFAGEPIICPGLPDLRFREGEEGGAGGAKCPPDSGTITMGSCSGWDDCQTYTGNDRLYRDGIGTPACILPHRACPGGGYAGTYYWNVYQFDNPGGSETCVTVAYTGGTCDAGFNGFLQAYEDEFEQGMALCPAAPVVYAGDLGSSTVGQFQFTIPSGVTRWSLLATNVFSQEACTMDITISGFDCQ